MAYERHGDANLVDGDQQHEDATAFLHHATQATLRTENGINLGCKVRSSREVRWGFAGSTKSQGMGADMISSRLSVS